MEREIFDILKAFDEKKLSLIDTHKKLCGMYIASGESILNQCLNKQEEVFSKNGIVYNQPF